MGSIRSDAPEQGPLWSRSVAATIAACFLVVLAGPAGAVIAPGTPKPTTTTSTSFTTTTVASAPPTVADMKIHFVQAEFATYYVAPDLGVQATYAWTLSPPASDPGCNNAGVLTSDTSQFVWHHPDPADSVPPGKYGCNHAVEGPTGHSGTVSVTVTASEAVADTTTGSLGAQYRCTSSYLGTSGADGYPEATAPFACAWLAAAAPSTTGAPTTLATTTTARSAPTTTGAANRPSGSSGGFPLWGIVLLVIGVLAAVGAGIVVRGRSPAGTTDCADLLKRCDELRAAAAEADRRASEARADADRAANDAAKAASSTSAAQHDLDTAEHPDEGSWIEDAETGVRITEYDLLLEKQAGGGPITDPAERAALRAAAVGRAQSALDAAKAAESQAEAASRTAGAAADRAASGAARARADADSACRAARECLDAAAAASAAAAAAAAAAKPPEAPVPSTSSSTPAGEPTVPTTGDPGPTTGDPGPGGPPGTTTQAPAPVPPPVAVRPPECEDGCDPRVEEHTETLEMYLVWAGKVEVAGTFQESSEDVDEAVEGFEKFKLVADAAEFVESFAGAGGSLAVGEIPLDVTVQAGTEAVSLGLRAFGAPDYTDPEGTIEDATTGSLGSVVKQFKAKRLLGGWRMSCPLVRVTATCTRTYECQGGRWVLTKHEFSLAYGPTLRWDRSPDPDSPQNVNYNNFDETDPARGARDVRGRLYLYFAIKNRRALARLKQIVVECGSAGKGS